MINVPSFRPNPDFPELCDKVTVGWDEKRGRYIEAKEDIPLGTVVCVEQGITVNIDPTKCYRCLLDIEDRQFAYCKNCEEFYEPDGLACGEFDQLGIFKLAAHLVFSYPFTDIVELLKADDPEPPKSAPTSLRSSDISAVLQLKPFLGIGDAFRMPQIQEAIKKMVDGLKEEDVNWKRLEDQSRLITFTKVLRIMAERCVKNAHTIYSIEQRENPKNNAPLGTGLFPISAIFNHSCTPNVSAFFIRNTFIFVSHGVKAGDELVDSYGVTLSQNTLQERTDFLSSVSGFQCHCDACVTQKDMVNLLDPCCNPERCSKSSQSVMDISDFLEHLEPGHKDIEGLITAFARRSDSDVYTEKMFLMWKMFIENANLRGIVYDPYLIRPNIEMTVLAWNDLVEVTEEEKMSLLLVSHRMLQNLFADLHPLSRFVNRLKSAVEQKKDREIRTALEKLDYVVRHIWKCESRPSSRNH